MAAVGAADSCHPVYYSSGLKKLMGKNIRKLRKLTDHAVIPWVTPGYSSTQYPCKWVYDVVLESYGSGVTGLYWYCFKETEAADLYYYAKAMEAVNPVAGVIYKSEPLAGISCNNKDFSVSALQKDGKYVLLISNYEVQGNARPLTIRLPEKIKGALWDLARKKKLIDNVSRQIKINFIPGVKGSHTALYYIGNTTPDFISKK
jgi:hypothetical protein